MATKTVEPDRSGTRAVRRVAGHFIRKAQRRLASPGLSDAAVHDARKDLKKSRAALRLLRTALGEPVYRRENASLRNAAHSLNAARDAKVLVQALDSLRRGSRTLEHDAAAVQLSRTLRAERSAIQQQLREHPASLAAARDALEQAGRRAGRWRVGRHGWSVLGPTLKRVYKTGRHRLPSARSNPDDAALHEWRKQVEYLRYALHVLTPMRPRALAALAERARGLSDHLGEAHDLSLLAQKARVFGQGNGASIEALLTAIDRHRARLVAHARVSGARLYRSKPGALTRQFGRYWRKWRQTARRR